MSFPERYIVAPLTEKLYQKAEKNKIPLHGTFELSPICNFSCRMCYVRKTAKEIAASGRKMMTLEQWIHLGQKARDAGMLYLLLTGGEPLLWPDFWELYDALYEMGLLIGINTNGSLIDDNAIQRWKDHPPYRVNLTLYGASNDTYETLCHTRNVYSEVKKAIIKMAEAGLNIKLNCSLTPYNAADLQEMVAFAKEKKIPLTVSTYMYPPVRRDAGMTGQNDRFRPEEAAWYHMQRYRYQKGEMEYREFLKNIQRKMITPPGLDEKCVNLENGKVRCRAGTSAFWVTWDGYMTPCGMMPEPKADLQEKSFNTVWKQLLEVSTKIHTSGTCEICKNQRICHSCAAMAYAETGKTSGIPVYLCEMMEAMKQIAQRELISRNGE